MSFESVTKFEKIIAKFFNAPYGIATDCCTHAIELCLRYKNIKKISIPTNTYISIPMLAIKLGIKWSWSKDKWKNFYFFKGTNIIDAAVLWKKNSYIKNTFILFLNLRWNLCLLFLHLFYFLRYIKRGY